MNNPHRNGNDLKTEKQRKRGPSAAALAILLVVLGAGLYAVVDNRPCPMNAVLVAANELPGLGVARHPRRNQP